MFFERERPPLARDPPLPSLSHSLSLSYTAPTFDEAAIAARVDAAVAEAQKEADDNLNDLLVCLGQVKRMERERRELPTLPVLFPLSTHAPPLKKPTGGAQGRGPTGQAGGDGRGRGRPHRGGGGGGRVKRERETACV